ncbi:hypothetical protein AERO8C_170023 [Aeromonas veronii]|uniref:Uncharacterized protein n=1 Tax=Aeromonas veronii TaxID=654 RepID=A0A653KYY3_AERVE|nr:hypothetical protein AERO8C_170023 [Aeromonas veronii]
MRQGEGWQLITEGLAGAGGKDGGGTLTCQHPADHRFLTWPECGETKILVEQGWDHGKAPRQMGDDSTATRSRVA